MSWLGFIFILEDEGVSKLLFDSINIFVSACDFSDKGKWIPIWSPSKSALNAEHTNGWSFIVFFFVILGLKACIPSLCSVGALFKSIG